MKKTFILLLSLLLIVSSVSVVFARDLSSNNFMLS